MENGLINSEAPLFLRGWATARAMPPIDDACMSRATLPPAHAEFALVERDGRLRTWAPDDVRLALAMFATWRRRGYLPSVFVMDVQRHCPELVALAREGLRPAAWRDTRIGISWSAGGGGFPAHADDADVLVVQSQGCRRWRVWDPGTIVDRRALVVGRRGRFVEADVLVARPCTLDVVLEPGDALFIPAFHLHAAESATEGPRGVVASASLVCAALTPYRLLALSGIGDAGLAAATSGDDAAWFARLADPVSGCSPRACYAEQLRLPVLAAHRAALDAGISRLVGEHAS